MIRLCRLSNFRRLPPGSPADLIWRRSLSSILALLTFVLFVSSCSVIAMLYQDGSVGVQGLDWSADEDVEPVAHLVSVGSSPVVSELNDRLVALPVGSPLEFSDEVFTSLDQAFAAAAVVGLGEATHGTAEFFELKHRLFRYLVEVHGHRALGYEFNFAVSLALDRYVTTGEGSLDDLLAGVSWIHANEEVRALLEWMREHNRGLPEDRRVRFIGIDSQLDMWHVELQRTLYRDRFPELDRQLGSFFDELEALGRIDYRALTEEEFDRIARLLATMASIVDQRSSDLSHEQRLVASHLIKALERSHEFLFSAYQGDNNVRDTHLADNALWIGELLGDGARYSLWAHNSHIGALPGFHGEKGPGSMGVRLTRRLGPRYLRIATAFTSGSFVAVRADWRGKDTTPIFCRLDSDPSSDSINAILDRASADRYLLNLRSIPDGSALDRFLDAERPMLGVGDFLADDIDVHYHSPDRITWVLDAYDVIFYFGETTGIQPLIARDSS